jgi:outer membrane lipoprotein SlyB
MRKLYSIPALLIAAAFLNGCANTTDPNTYSVGSVGQVNRSVAGNVISARPIRIDANTGAGGAVGGLAGAVAGSSVGGGTRANALGAIGGAVAGAVIGSAIEHSGSQRDGMEYVIATQNGSLMTIAQGVEPLFAEGDKVIILYGSPSRVIKDPRP